MRCENPITLQNEQAGTRKVQCGQCLPCLHKRVQGWTFRLQQHQKVNGTSLFVTLTYRTKYLPLSRIIDGKEVITQAPKYSESWNVAPMPTLRKADLQLFMKRLRQIHARAGNSSKISYYAVGEYGGRFKRPHYHLIIFNASREHIAKAWQIDGDPIGKVHFGHDCGSDAIAYVAKYVNKVPSRNWHHSDNRLKEFSCMSKGIGINYVTDAMKRWHTENKALYIVQPGGIKMPMPRYYRGKIFEPELLEELSYQNYVTFKKQEQEEIDKIGIDQYWSLLQQKAENSFRKARSKAKERADRELAIEMDMEWQT